MSMMVLSPTTPFDMVFNVNGTFRMGHNEKFTSAGSLTINAGTQAYLGDLNIYVRPLAYLL